MTTPSAPSAQERATPFAADTAPSGDDDRTMIRTVRGRMPGQGGRDGWVHDLVYTNAAGQVQRLRLGSAPVRIGRRAPCELVLKDNEVSGVHCELQLRGDDLYVSDRGSTNGTFVDGRRVFAAELVPHGGVLQLGRQQIKHEFRDGAELAQSEAIDRDLVRASRYVRSLLPAPLPSGPVQAQWFFQPSARVGGDAFGYHWLNSNRLLIYLLDVSGHGVGAAMHGVQVLGTLRQQSLPGTNFCEPREVLARLNERFQMDSHGGMFFTIWYGVYDLESRVLRYASAGQHPAFVRNAQGQLRALQTHNLVIGAMPDTPFEDAATQLAPGEKLYLFSDGVWEIVTPDGRNGSLDDFLALLGEPPVGGHAEGVSEPEHLFKVVQGLARPGGLDDDFSLVVLTAQ